MLPRVSLLFLLVLGLAPLHADPTAAPEIPFELVDGFILLQARIEPAGRPVNLLLDSGAGASVLNLETARRMRIKLGATEPVRGVGTEVSAFHMNGIAAEADGVALGSIPLAVDLDNATMLCSRHIDGLIGVSFFANRVVEIDFAQRHLRLLPAAERAGTGTDACRLPITPVNGVLCVPISVNGSKPRLARLDTGCNDALHWVVPQFHERRMRPDVSIGFITDTSNPALSHLHFGNQRLENIPTSLHAHALFPGEAGLLGNGVLSQYVVTVDTTKQQVLFRRAAAP